MDIGGSIEIFQDVSFKYPRENSPTLRTNLKDNVNPPWQLDREWEEEIKNRTDYETEIIAFSRESIDEAGSSYLCLWNDTYMDWRIPNVVPQDFGNRFTICQYNDILNDFIEFVLSPVLDSLNTEIVITPRRLKLQDLMSAESINLLQAFLSLGDGGVSIMHPNDEQRLCRFIWSLHEHDKSFDADLFRRWLEEAHSWPNEHASNLAIRVDQGLTLLNSR